ncbi:DUF6745 domain-containing protein [Actinoplanes sp. NPDC051494]|uniref:DUF6745 domain-containing protein n=1 Tax=Actinoplanes sp. NPDC051494 TaxID=3363907 RepID=UPI00379EA2D4
MALTAAQETAAAAIEDQWLATALRTGPANRPAAEEALAQTYRAAGLPPPDRVYWLGSPHAGAIAAALLTGTAPAEPAPAVAFPGAASGGPVADVVAALRQQGWEPGSGATAGAPVRTAVRTTPWATARAEALAAHGMDDWAHLSAAAGRRCWDLVMDRVAGRLRTRLREDLADIPGDLGRAASRAVLDAVYGQHDAAWLAPFDAAARLLPRPAAAEPDRLGALAGLAALARETGWWWPFADVAILTERPVTLSRDNVGRLHSETAALEFPDGYQLWAWRGMPIPPGLAAELPTLTAGRIAAEENAELRRVMLEHYGYERYLRESGARRLGEDETGILWYLDLPRDEPLVMVEVVNATPEPDGTSRVYWLRVPPRTRTAREGVAWTFGLEAADYHPRIQT